MLSIVKEIEFQEKPLYDEIIEMLSVEAPRTEITKNDIVEEEINKEANICLNGVNKIPDEELKDKLG